MLIGSSAPASTAPAEQELPGPIDVCVEGDDGSLAAGSAVSSRAGVYDPAAPIDPTLLDWMVAGQGCVNYPSARPRNAICGERAVAAPVVGHRLCEQ